MANDGQSCTGLRSASRRLSRRRPVLGKQKKRARTGSKGLVVQSSSRAQDDRSWITPRHS